MPWYGVRDPQHPALGGNRPLARRTRRSAGTSLPCEGLKGPHGLRRAGVAVAVHAGHGWEARWIGSSPKNMRRLWEARAPPSPSSSGPSWASCGRVAWASDAGGRNLKPRASWGTGGVSMRRRRGATRVAWGLPGSPRGALAAPAFLEVLPVRPGVRVPVGPRRCRWSHRGGDSTRDAARGAEGVYCGFCQSGPKYRNSPAAETKDGSKVRPTKANPGPCSDRRPPWAENVQFPAPPGNEASITPRPSWS